MRVGGSPELLREAAIAELEKLEGDVLTNLLSLYFEEAVGQVSELSDAIRRSDTLAVGQTAHKLMGSSLTLGAAHVSRIAFELETAANAGDLTVAEELLNELRTGLDETRHAFRIRVAESPDDDGNR
jgi:HPt (histidine-containing phosphotransfer) domain-containing protein